jgi:hypothetical protein
VKLTSGGIDNGARPSCEARLVEAEKNRDETTGNAGRRKDGMDTNGAEAIALSRPFERVVESIVYAVFQLKPLDIELHLWFGVSRLVTVARDHFVRTSTCSRRPVKFVHRICSSVSIED